MALIKDIAGRDRRIVETAESSLRHDQSVVGDDNSRLPRFADVLLDKAAAEMRAGRVHAFAAAVGEPTHPTATDQLREPAWKVAGDQIAGLARADPSRDQPQLSCRPPRPADRGADRLFIIQQTKKILPALADRHVTVLDIGVGIKP